MFPENLLGLSPDSQLEFGIDLLSGSALISIPPYRMAPIELKELKELKKQLQDLIDKCKTRTRTIRVLW